jgi:hypothetical protein
MKIITNYNEAIANVEANEGSLNQITPNELICKFNGIKEDDQDYTGLRCYSSTRKRLVEYGKLKCVIVYSIDSFGAIFIIKSSKKYFAFTVRNNILGRPYDYNVCERDLKVIIPYLDSNLQNTKILNNDEYDKLKRLLVAESLGNIHG